MLEFERRAVLILKAEIVSLPKSIVFGDTHDLDLQLSLQLVKFFARAV
jgi:hypothetical protein